MARPDGRNYAYGGTTQTFYYPPRAGTQTRATENLNVPGPGNSQRFVSGSTGLTVVSVLPSSSHQPVSLTDRAAIVRNFPNVVLINSYGIDGMLLGVGRTPWEVYRYLVSWKGELPDWGLLYSLQDVSENDPFACLEGMPIIPRVNQSGLYQINMRTKLLDLEAKRSPEELVSSFQVVSAVKKKGEIVVEVSHLLEYVAYYECLQHEPGVSLEIPQSLTWLIRHTGKFERRRVGQVEGRDQDQDRFFWVTVTAPEFDSLHIPSKQMNMNLLLSKLGRVKQLEHQLFGLENNYLAVLQGNFSSSDVETGMTLTELSFDSIPATYIPTHTVDSHGFYTISGRFPDDVPARVRQKFAEDIKHIGAVGFTGGEDFCLYFVNSKSAGAALALQRLIQYSTMGLQLGSSKETQKKKEDKLVPPTININSVKVGDNKSSREEHQNTEISKETQVSPDSPDKQSAQSDKGNSGICTPSEAPPCVMTETDLLTVNWQQGKSLPDSLKSMAKFLVSINVVEVTQSEDIVRFKLSEKKKFIKSLKIFSRNESNSFDKLRSTTPRLALSACRDQGNMFGLNVMKRRGIDLDSIKNMMAKYPETRIDENTHMYTVWLPTKLDYFKALTDKNLSVNFIPTIQNYQQIKAQTVPVKNKESASQPETEEPLQMLEKSIFGLIGRNITEGDELAIARQLTDFIRNVKCSQITNKDDELVFHFSSREDFNNALAKFFPEFAGDKKEFDLLTRKFLFKPFRGKFGIFSVKSVESVDFKIFANSICKINDKIIWFWDKLEIIKILRDPKISVLYPNLYICVKNITILRTYQTRFGNNVKFSDEIPGPFNYPRLSSCNQRCFERSNGMFQDRSDIPYGWDNIPSPAYLYDNNNKRRMEERFGAVQEEAMYEELGGDAGPMEEDHGGVVTADFLIPYDKESDPALYSKLYEDISWFDDPVSILLTIHSSTGLPVFRVTMIDQKMATAAFVGLKQKFPGMEMVESGAEFDIKRDEQSGLYTLMFTDQRRMGYVGTKNKFKQFCFSPQDGPFIRRLYETVLIGYRNKKDALRALREVDINFPELQVAPVSRVE